jgi:5-aminolevulinate synthase
MSATVAAELPTPFHDDALIAGLVAALSKVWEQLGLPRSVRGEEPARLAATHGGNTRVGIFPPAGG